MTIREETMETVRAYVYERVPPGSYLLAVLSNDLMGAFKRASDQSLAEMPELVKWLYNNAPHTCMGSRQVVDAWLDGAYGAAAADRSNPVI